MTPNLPAPQLDALAAVPGSVDQDPVYGGGFRAVRPRADRLGLPRFVPELAAPSQGRQRS